MTLKSLEKVLETEQKSRERKTAAEAEARQFVADAEQKGLALLLQVRANAAAEEKLLLQRMEEQAVKQAEEIARAAEEESVALRKAAEVNLEEAAEYIVGKVVMQ